MTRLAMAIYSNLYQFYRTSHSDKIKSISKPLETHFGIDVFAYSNSADNGDFYQISNVPEVALIPWENETYKSNFFLKDPSVYAEGVYFLNGIGDLKYKNVLTFMNKKGVNLYLRIVRKDEDGCHQFLFGTKGQELPFNSLFLRETNLIHSFCDYFLEEASPILKRCDSYTFSLAELLGSSFKDKSHYTPALAAAQVRDKFLAEISPEYARTLSLSRQEKRCLIELFKGKTATEIGLSLDLSPRTVEFYLINVKNKMDCYTNRELVNKLSKFQKYLAI